MQKKLQQLNCFIFILKVFKILKEILVYTLPLSFSTLLALFLVYLTKHFISLVFIPLSIILSIIFAVHLIAPKIIKEDVVNTLETWLTGENLFLLHSILELARKGKNKILEDLLNGIHFDNKKFWNKLIPRASLIAILYALLIVSTYMNVYLLKDGGIIEGLEVFVGTGKENWIHYPKTVLKDQIFTVIVEQKPFTDKYILKPSINSQISNKKIIFSISLQEKGNNSIKLYYEIFRIPRIEEFNIYCDENIKIISGKIEGYVNGIKLWEMEGLGDINTFENTELAFHIRSNVPLDKTSDISFENNNIVKNIQKIVSNEILDVLFEVKGIGSTKYSIIMKSGEKKLEKAFRIKIRPATSPYVSISFPDTNNILPILKTPFQIYIKYNAKDEVGISKINILGYLQNKLITERRKQFLNTNTYISYHKHIEEYEKNIEKTYLYDSTTYGGYFLPGDILQIYVVAENVFGKSSYTKISAYIPTFPELQKLLSTTIENLQSQIKKLEKIMEQAENAESEKVYKELLENVGKNLEDIERDLKELELLAEELEKNVSTIEQLQKLVGDMKKEIKNMKNTETIRDIKQMLSLMRKTLETLKNFSDIEKALKTIKEMEETIRSLISEEEKYKFLRKSLDTLKDIPLVKSNPVLKDKMEKLEEALGEKNLVMVENNLQEIKNILEDLKKYEATKDIGNLKKILEEVYLEEAYYLGILQDRYKNFTGEGGWESIDGLNKAIVAGIQALPFYLTKIEGIIATQPILIPYMLKLRNIHQEILIQFDSYKSAILDRIKPLVIVSYRAIFENYLKFEEILLELISLLNNMEEAQAKADIYSLDQLISLQQQLVNAMKQFLESSGEQAQKLLKSIEELQKRISSIANKLFKEAGGIKEEIKAVERDIEERRISQETFERAKKILQNLLEYKKGIQEKGLSEKRKAERPQPYVVKPPQPELSPHLYTIPLNLSKYDKEILEKYVELLKNQ